MSVNSGNIKLVSLSEPQEYTITSTQDINLFLAGIGSGKTHIGGFLSGFYITKFPEVFGFIGANTHQQLTTSTLFRLREVWREYFSMVEGRDYVVGKKPPKHFKTDAHNFDSYDGIISFKNGAVVFKGSLDNAKAHDGKEFGWALLDETKDSREDDVKDIILTRMRKAGMYVDNVSGQIVNKPQTDGVDNRAFNPLYILTSPAKVLWINEWFKLDEYQNDIQAVIYDKENFFVREFDDKSVVISNTYHNEANLPKGFIEKIINNQTKENAKRLIYGNPFVRSGGEFYSSFDRMRQVLPVIDKDGNKTVVAFDPTKAVHISFDQNVVPYITMTCYQLHYVGNKIIIAQFDEICLANPNNKTEKLCIEFIKRYGKYLTHGLYYYGDPSGRKSDTRANEHDYLIVQRILKKYLNNKSERVPYVHPPVVKRKDFINNIFELKYIDRVEFFIAEHCKKSITDLEFVKEDKNGKKFKEVVKDKDTNQTYEKLGHTSDSMDYFLCEVLNNMFTKFME